MARPEMPADGRYGISMPGWLRYSANHMWLDVAQDGMCHAGIDAFLSRALGEVDRITYVWTKGLRRPAAVLTVAGVDLEVVFPNEFLLTNCNLYLRADPSKLTSQPYSTGWLFEGTPAPGTKSNLLQGAAARRWMEQEQRRINEFLQQEMEAAIGPLAADGGLFTAGIGRQLERERKLTLFHEFFSPYAGAKR
jgi:glycine cleavage system H protein